MTSPNPIASSLRIVSKLGGQQRVSRALHPLPARWTEFDATVQYRSIFFEVNTGEETGRRMYYFNEYERAQENVLLELVNPQSLVFDIGANIGLFCFLSVSQGAHVVAFEPSRLLAARFTRNLALTNMSNVVLVPEAVSDCEGAISFYETRAGNFGVGRVFAFGHSRNTTPSHSVPTNTVYSYVARFGMPALIQIDIEGAEWLALKGASETFKQPNSPVLLIECHPEEIHSLRGSLASRLVLLESYGLRRYRLEEAEIGTHKWYVFSRKQCKSSRLILDC